MSFVHRRQRRAFRDEHSPDRSEVPLQEYTDAARKMSLESSDVCDIRVSMTRSSSMQSLDLDSDDFVNIEDEISRDSFQREVAEKIQSHFVVKQEAETEVFIGRVVRKTGSKHMALLFIVSKLNDESQVQILIKTLLHRGANPSARDKNRRTALHFAVEKKFKGVCSKLLENKAKPDARDKQGNMPYTLSYNADNDDISAMLINFMSNVADSRRLKHSVRRMYTSDGKTPAEFNFNKLLEKNMQKTVLAVLDCMMDRQSPCGDVHVFYNVLDSDDNGMVPTQPDFNPKSKSPLQVIAKSGNKAELNETWKRNDSIEVLTKHFYFLDPSK